jgi:hypothetical protein
MLHHPGSKNLHLYPWNARSVDAAAGIQSLSALSSLAGWETIYCHR